jgi:hypothetical protein
MKALPALAAGGVAALAAAALFAALTFTSKDAGATMRFTEQTGKPCTFCHAGSPPALNDQGKRFKANGNKL